MIYNLLFSWVKINPELSNTAAREPIFFVVGKPNPTNRKFQKDINGFSISIKSLHKKELIKNLFKDNEKRKQLLAINGSFISKYKVGDNIELMAIAVRQNSDNIQFIKPKYRDIVLKLVN